MRISTHGLVAAGAVSLLAMGPAAVASTVSSSDSAASPSAATAPPKEVKGFLLLRGFPGELIKGGMGTFSEECSRGNNGRPFEFRGGDARLDVTVTHNDHFYDPRCADSGPRSNWELVIVSPRGVTGAVRFFLGWEPGIGNVLFCRGSQGDIRCLDDHVSGPDLRMTVEARR
jgi:hypothetical protein